MPDKNIVLGILAHVDAGKTTLSEAILYKTGVIRKMGRVDHRGCLSRYGFYRTGQRHNRILKGGQIFSWLAKGSAHRYSGTF